MQQPTNRRPNQVETQLTGPLVYGLGFGIVIVLCILMVAILGWLLNHLGVSEPILSVVMAVSIGVIVFQFGIRVVTGMRVTLKDAFWASAIGHIYPTAAALFLGMLFWKHTGLVLIAVLATSIIFQSVVFRILIRAKGGTLPKGKSYILASVMVLADFLISSPIVGLIVKER